MRVLIVGIGTRGRHWVRLVHETAGVEPVGYVDTNPEQFAWLFEQYGVSETSCFADLHAALEALRPDLTILATPPDGHLGEARAIFAAGCHLLAEKPLTLDLAEAIGIIESAKMAGRALLVGMNFRYLHTTRAIKRLIAEELGAPSFARFVYWRYRDGRRPGINKYPLTMHQPMLYEQSIHHLDLLRYVYAREVETVWCRCHNPPWSMYADDATVHAQLQMVGNLLVDYFGTWAGRAPLNEFEWRTDCEHGVIVQHEQFADVRVTAPTSTTPERIELPRQEDFVDDTRMLLADAVNQLKAGVPQPHPSGVDHLLSLALAVACEESSVTCMPVQMREFLDRHGITTNWLAAHAG